MKKYKNIVCLGGGNAMPRAVLPGLKKYPVKISVICAMLDSGGSAGRLRKDYKIVSPGDIRRAFIALANTSPVIENLFNYRFQTGLLKDHNFANLLILALELATKDYGKALKEVGKILNVSHQVLPVTLDKANLYAVLENGKIISGETNIDIPKHNGNLRIKRVFLKPKAKAYPQAIEAILKADLIAMGPGDLYSSLAQILLTDGIPQAIKKTKAKIVYVCNLMTKYGETNNFTVHDFVNEVEKFLGQEDDEDKSHLHLRYRSVGDEDKSHLHLRYRSVGDEDKSSSSPTEPRRGEGKDERSSSPFAVARVLDYVIYNNKMPSAKRLTIYKKKHPELLDLVQFDEGLSKEKKFIGTDILTKSGDIIHDPDKLAKIILSI